MWSSSSSSSTRGRSPSTGGCASILTEIPEARLLSLLNVKYRLTDKIKDVWVDNVYYDLGNSVTVSPTAPVWSLQDLAPFPTGEIGIVSYLQGAAAVADGTPVASVTIRDATGAVDTYLVRAGRDTAETFYSAARRTASAQAGAGGRHLAREPVRQHATSADLDPGANPDSAQHRDPIRGDHRPTGPARAKPGGPAHRRRAGAGRLAGRRVPAGARRRRQALREHAGPAKGLCRPPGYRSFRPTGPSWTR